MSEFLQIYDDVIDKETCDLIIKSLEGSDLFETAITNGDNDSRDTDIIHLFTERSSDELTKNKLNTLFYEDILGTIKTEAIDRYINDTYDILNTHIPSWHISQYDYLRYESDVGEYKLHVDNSYIPEDHTHHRILSIILYLNDIESGGETTFPYHNLSIKPEAGKCVVFPSDWTYPHKSELTVGSNKYVMVLWVSIT